MSGAFHVMSVREYYVTERKHLYGQSHQRRYLQKKRFYKIISLCFDFQDIIDQKIFMKNYMNN